MNKKRKRITTVIAVILMIVIGSTVYLKDAYPASSEAEAVLKNEEAQDMKIVQEKSEIAFIPENVTAGLIFYPGGKVQYEAYVPLMQLCAQNGVLSVLVHMPGNLAIFDVRAADRVKEAYPEVERWFIAGHSLGGSMAAVCAGKNEGGYEGLILLAAYSTEDLSAQQLRVLSVYGSEDRVLNMEKYDQNKKNLPEDVRETVISGGCHAGFGSYGAQKGDGTPTIDSETQMKKTAALIVQFVNGTQKPFE